MKPAVGLNSARLLKEKGMKKWSTAVDHSSRSTHLSKIGVSDIVGGGGSKTKAGGGGRGAYRESTDMNEHDLGHGKAESF